MKCPKCGAELKDTREPCPNCGKKMTDRELKIERMLNKKRKEKEKKNGFLYDVGKAYKDFWLKIFDVKSYSSIKDFWYAMAINMIIAFICVIAYHWVAVAFMICITIPLLTSMIRRIRDTGREWFYLILALLPGAGFVVLLLLLCLPSYYTTIDESKPKKKKNNNK